MVPALIRASDVCLVLLKKAEVFKTVVPTKMLEFMACGRAVVLGVDGQARAVMDEAHAGISIEPEDSSALAAAVARLYHDAGLRTGFAAYTTFATSRTVHRVAPGGGPSGPGLDGVDCR